MSAGDDTCDHYDQQSAIRMFDLAAAELDEDFDCDWCGDDAVLGLLKDERHELLLCQDCRATIRILAQDSSDGGEQ